MPTPGGGSPDQLPVSPEAKRALYPLGEVLGRYDGRGQQAAIAGARRELEGLRARPGRSVSGWERCTGPWG